MAAVLSTAARPIHFRRDLDRRLACRGLMGNSVLTSAGWLVQAAPVAERWSRQRAAVHGFLSLKIVLAASQHVHRAMYMGVTHNVENRMESAVGETDPANRRALLVGDLSPHPICMSALDTGASSAVLVAPATSRRRRAPPDVEWFANVARLNLRGDCLKPSSLDIGTGLGAVACA
jgi:hypothetical protein